MEAHTRPLSYDSPFAPLRGRYCLDSSCARLDDANDYRSEYKSRVKCALQHHFPSSRSVAVAGATVRRTGEV